MSAANLLASFQATMIWEGSERLSLVRSDPGNWTGNRVGVGKLVGTKWGVSAGSHPALDIPNLSEDQAAAIFQTGYWVPIGGDDLPIGLDHCVSDAAYSEGPSAARNFLARSGVDAHSEPIRAIKDFSTARLAYLKSLRTWATFGVGWARRVGGVEGESLRMAMTEQGVPALQQMSELGNHAAIVRSKAKAKFTGAVAASIPAAATLTLPHGGPFELLLGLCVFLLLGLVATAIFNNARADGIVAAAKPAKKA